MSRLGLGLDRQKGLGLDTTEGVGAPYLATEASLRALYQANVGANTPHTLPVMVSPPTIRTGAGTDAVPAAPDTDLSVSYRYSIGSNVFNYFGGGAFTFGGTYRRFPVATRFTSGGNVDGGVNGVTWRTGVRHTGSRIAFRVTGSSTLAYRFIVNGQYVSLTGTLTATTSGRNYIVLDFGSSATRDIYVENQQSAGFDGVYVAVGDTVVAIPSVEPGIVLFLGDSFTTGTGASFNNDGYFNPLAEQLGFDNIWASGVGSTGYVQNQSNTLYNLQERIVADVTRAQSFGEVKKVFFAMGGNDIGLSGIQAGAAFCLDTIRSMLPAASVSVLGPFDGNAPLAPVTNYAACKSAIQAAMAGRGGFHFLDMEGVAFAKVNPGVDDHPNTAGHLTLANDIYAKEYAALAA